MAEFVSAIVGLIAVGARTGDGLHSLIDTFKGAPNEILALFEEMKEFQAMLSDLLEVSGLEESTSENQVTSNIDFSSIVKNGQQTVEKIDALIARVRRERFGQPSETQVNRFQWVWVAKKAKKLQELLRVQKATMCNFVALRILYGSQ
jgi:hypothetical protein